MKAYSCTKYGPPEVLKLVEVATPTPKDNEVRIKIHCTSVTMADHRLRSFTIPPAFWLPAKIMLGWNRPKKSILGMEVAGVVDACGANVKNFKAGDRVFAATLATFGGYAEFVCLDQSGPIVKIPPTIEYSQAAAIPIGARTALHYLKKLDIKKGKKMLVYGASGSVGTYLVQLANHQGYAVTGVCSKKNQNLVHSLGAKKVLDYEHPEFFRQLEAYDVVFLAVDKMPFELIKDHMEPHGTYVNVTAPVKSFQMIWTEMTSKKKILVGEKSIETAEDLQKLVDFVETGELKVVVDQVFSFDQMVEAHRYVDLGHKVGNVLVEVVDSSK